ncbi:MAG: carbohydrate-binding domain-containing protein, partial [Bacteroidota bacterium]
TDFRRQAQRDCQSSWVSSNLISITLTAPQSCANVTSAGSSNYAGQTNVTANSFDPPNISNGSAASGGTGGSIAYRWQQRENGGSWSTISGATGSSYNPPSISTSTDFRRQAQRDCQSSWISSNVIVISLTPPPSGSDLVVNAYGTTGEEVIELQIDGVTVTSWTLTTSPADYTYSNYSGGTSSPIQVAFNNDGLSSGNVDKNVFVDYIEITGTVYQTETNAERLPVGACGDDQWLWCNGYFEFFGNSSSRPANLSTGLGYVPNLNVYPNPVVDNYFTVLIEDFREEHLLEIFDLEGRKLLERRLSASNTTLRPNLGDGTYIVQISNAHGFTAYRLLISNR